MIAATPHRSSSEFEELLRRFESAVRDTGAGVAGLLAPGIPEQQVRAELRAVDMEPARELITWFGWHNGLTDPHPASWGDGLLVTWCPLSLEESLEEWRRQDLGPEPWEWCPTWLPIGLSGSAPRLAVDCTPPQGECAKVRAADPWSGLFDEQQIPSVVGLATVVTWWLDSLEQGHVTYDAEHDGWDRAEANNIPSERRRTFLV